MSKPHIIWHVVCGFEDTGRRSTWILRQETRAGYLLGFGDRLGLRLSRYGDRSPTQMRRSDPSRGLLGYNGQRGYAAVDGHAAAAAGRTWAGKNFNRCKLV